MMLANLLIAEPCRLYPSKVKISRRNQANMVQKIKVSYFLLPGWLLQEAQEIGAFIYVHETWHNSCLRSSSNGYHYSWNLIILRKWRPLFLESRYSPKMKTVILGISLFSEKRGHYSWNLVILPKWTPRYYWNLVILRKWRLLFLVSRYSPKSGAIILGIWLFSENEDRYSWYLVILRKAEPLFLVSRYFPKMKTVILGISFFSEKWSRYCWYLVILRSDASKVHLKKDVCIHAK